MMAQRAGAGRLVALLFVAGLALIAPPAWALRGHLEVNGSDYLPARWGLSQRVGGPSSIVAGRFGASATASLARAQPQPALADAAGPRLPSDFHEGRLQVEAARRFEKTASRLLVSDGSVVTKARDASAQAIVRALRKSYQSIVQGRLDTWKQLAARGRKNDHSHLLSLDEMAREVRMGQAILAKPIHVRGRGAGTLTKSRLAGLGQMRSFSTGSRAPYSPQDPWDVLCLQHMSKLRQKVNSKSPYLVSEEEWTQYSAVLAIVGTFGHVVASWSQMQQLEKCVDEFCSGRMTGCDLFLHMEEASDYIQSLAAEPVRFQPFSVSPDLWNQFDVALKSYMEGEDASMADVLARIEKEWDDKDAARVASAKVKARSSQVSTTSSSETKHEELFQPWDVVGVHTLFSLIPRVDHFSNDSIGFRWVNDIFLAFRAASTTGHMVESWSELQRLEKIVGRFYSGGSTGNITADILRMYLDQTSRNLQRLFAKPVRSYPFHVPPDLWKQFDSALMSYFDGQQGAIAIADIFAQIEQEWEKRDNAETFALLVEPRPTNSSVTSFHDAAAKHPFSSRQVASNRTLDLANDFLFKLDGKRGAVSVWKLWNKIKLDEIPIELQRCEAIDALEGAFAKAILCDDEVALEAMECMGTVIAYGYNARSHPDFSQDLASWQIILETMGDALLRLTHLSEAEAARFGRWIQALSLLEHLGELGAGFEKIVAGLDKVGAGLEGSGAGLEGSGAGLEGSGAGLEGPGAGLDEPGAGREELGARYEEPQSAFARLKEAVAIAADRHTDEEVVLRELEALRDLAAKGQDEEEEKQGTAPSKEQWNARIGRSIQRLQLRGETDASAGGT